MTTSQVTSAKSGAHKNNGKRSIPDEQKNYGGWNQADHLRFIESNT